jgi:hypothetical protein
LIWLRMDVDNPCYYHPVYTHVRLRYPVPIPGYYRHVRDTLGFLNSKHPTVRCKWFIRSIILPPRNLLDDAEVGLHVTEPTNIMKEYSKVVSWLGHAIHYYTAHGKAPVASGRDWNDQDRQYVDKVLPHLTDLSNRPHYTITRLPDTPSKLDLHGIDHILFHPVHFRMARDQLDMMLERISDLV